VVDLLNPKSEIVSPPRFRYHCGMVASLFNLAGPDLIIMLVVGALFVGVPVAIVVAIVLIVSRKKRDAAPPPLARTPPPDGV
jgi:adenine/guanine phosphoribosyltransferase-like PRPP-binding protein